MNKLKNFETFVLLVFCFMSVNFIPSFQTCLKKTSLELRVGEEGTLVSDELPFQIVSLGAKMCIQGGGSDGDEISMTYCFSADSRYNWQRISYGNNYYGFANEKSNLALEAKCGDTSKYGSIREWRLTNLNNQTLLMIMSGTNFQLQFQHSKKCLEVEEKRLIQNDCNASNQNQLFKQKRVTFVLPETWTHIKSTNGNCLGYGANRTTLGKACNDSDKTQMYMFNRHTDGSIYIQNQNVEVLEDDNTDLKVWDFQDSRQKRWFINQKEESNQILLVNQGTERCINNSMKMVSCNFDDINQLWTLTSNTVFSPIPRMFFSVEGANSYALRWGIGSAPTSEPKRDLPGLYGFRLLKNTNGTFRVNSVNGLTLNVRKEEIRSMYGVLLRTNIYITYENDSKDKGEQSFIILPKGKDQFLFKLTGNYNDWCVGFPLSTGMGTFTAASCASIYPNNIAPYVVTKPPVDEPIMIKNFASGKCMAILNTEESPVLIDCIDTNPQQSFTIEYNPSNYYYYFKHYSGLSFESEDAKCTVRRLDRNHGRHRYVIIKLDAQNFAISESERNSCLQVVNGALTKAVCNFSNEQKFSFETSSAVGLPENYIRFKPKLNVNFCISDLDGRGKQTTLRACSKTNDQAFMILRHEESNLFNIRSSVGYNLAGGDANMWNELPEDGKTWQRFHLLKHLDNTISIMNPYVGGRRCLTSYISGNAATFYFEECKFTDGQKYVIEDATITPIPTNYVQIKNRKKNQCITQEHLYKKVYFADCVVGDMTQAFKFRKDPEGFFFFVNFGGLAIKEDWSYYLSWDWWPDSGTRFFIRNISEKYFVIISQDVGNKPLVGLANDGNLKNTDNSFIDTVNYEQHFEFIPFTLESPFDGATNSLMFKNRKSQKCIKFEIPYEVLKMGDCQQQNESMALFFNNEENRGFSLQFINDLAVDNWSWRNANWDLHRGSNQQFVFFPQRDGSWKYTSKDRLRDCIMQGTDVNNPVTYTNDCNNENTKWDITAQSIKKLPKNWIMIVNVANGKCLRRPNANENPVELGDCEANKNKDEYLWLISKYGNNWDIQDYQKKGLVHTSGNDNTKVTTRDGDYNWSFTPVAIQTFHIRNMDTKKCLNFANKTSAVIAPCNLTDKNSHFIFKDPLA